MECLKHKVILITGASSGIGRGTAIYFAKLGSKLSLTGRNADRLQETKDACVEQGLDVAKIVCIPADITVGKERQHIINATIAAFNQLDVLVNNAGIGPALSITECSEDDFLELMKTNLVAPFQLVNIALPYLKISKGNVVNVSSVLRMEADRQFSAYSMTKAALDCYTKNLAVELAELGIRVNSVNPGFIRTNIIAKTNPHFSTEQVKEVEEIQRKKSPLGRNGDPEDVAKCIAVLASDLSNFVTGQYMFPAGGRNCASF